MSIRITPINFAILQSFFLLLLLLLMPVAKRWGMFPESTTLYTDYPEEELITPAEAMVETPSLQPVPTQAQLSRTYAKNVTDILASPPPSIEYNAEIEDKVFSLINKEREKQSAGLVTLEKDEFLRDSSRAHSVDMIKRNFFDHINPDRNGPGYRIATIHRNLIGTTGENIFSMPLRSGVSLDEAEIDRIAKAVVKGWMNSPGHRQNILSDRYTHMGMGIAKKGDRLLISQNFASTQANLIQGLPLHLAKGDKLSLETNPSQRQEAPVKYDLWNPERGIVVSKEPLNLDEPLPDLPTGTYQLRFYFVDSTEDTDKGSVTNHAIYSGPLIIL